jgi:hypothetical protein
MIPAYCIDTLLFPYSLDVYYSDLEQDEYGAVEPTWSYSRTIKAQVVNVYEDSSNDRPMLLENQNRFQLWDESYVVRTLDNVLKDGATWYTPQQTRLTNIRTSTGVYYWDAFSTGEPMRLEVRGIIQILDPFEQLHHYKITAILSNDQDS